MEGIWELIKKGKEIQKELHEFLKGVRVEASSGGEMVKVVMDGEQNILELEIEPSLLSQENQKMLEDLIISAVNETKKKAQEEAKRKLKELIGFPLPGII